MRRLRGQDQLVDIGIENGRIRGRSEACGEARRRSIDARGQPRRCRASFNLHFHADKCLLGEVMRPNLSGTLPEAIEITNDFKRKYDPKEVAARTLRALETGVKNGTTFFRLFADVGTIGGLEGARDCCWRARSLRNTADIQVVAFPQEGIVRDPGAAELMDEAIKEGCDVVGGLPWYEYTDEEARQHIDICFDIAKRHDLDIHMLVDDTDDAEFAQPRISRAQDHARGFPRPRRRQPLRRDGGLQRRLRRQGRSTWWRPPASPSRSTRTSTWSARRGSIASPSAAASRASRSCWRAASTSSRRRTTSTIPYYPFGKPDPLECALMMAHVAQLTLPHELEQVMDMITVNSARAARVSDYGIAPGCRADLVVVERSLGARGAAARTGAQARHQGRARSRAHHGHAPVAGLVRER